MSKEHEIRKETKKKGTKSLKEKRLEKKMKKSGVNSHGQIHVE